MNAIGRLLRDYLQPILNDHRSGSVEILNNTCEALLKFSADGRLYSGIEPWILVAELKLLLRKHAHLVVLLHFVNKLFLQLDTRMNTELAPDELMAFVTVYRQKWKDVNKQIASHAVKQIDLKSKKVLLHSNSSTIIGVFEELAALDILPIVYQTVSHPAEEGKIQAEILADLGFVVYLIEDAAIARFVDYTDLAITGADVILEDRFMNKTGTALIAAIYESHKKPLCVLGDSRKLMSETALPPLTKDAIVIEVPKSGTELWRNAPSNIKPLNYYFEWTPNDAVSQFIFENGAIGAADLKQKVQEFNISSLIS